MSKRTTLYADAEPTEFGSFLLEKLSRKGMTVEDLARVAHDVGFRHVKAGPLKRAVYDGSAEALNDVFGGYDGWGPALEYLLKLSEAEVMEMVGIFRKVVWQDYRTA